MAAFDDDGLPVAWVLQVATVSSVEKARKLRDELIGNGEKAFYEPLRRDNDTLYRVYVGPKFERAQLAPLLRAGAALVRLRFWLGLGSG